MHTADKTAALTVTPDDMFSVLSATDVLSEMALERMVANLSGARRAWSRWAGRSRRPSDVEVVRVVYRGLHPQVLTVHEKWALALQDLQWICSWR